MDINAYLEKHGLSQSDFGKLIGVTQSFISQVLNGAVRITAERAVEIEEKTRGEITRHDLRPDLFGKRNGKKVA